MKPVWPIAGAVVDCGVTEAIVDCGISGSCVRSGQEKGCGGGGRRTGTKKLGSTNAGVGRPNEREGAALEVDRDRIGVTEGLELVIGNDGRDEKRS